MSALRDISLIIVIGILAFLLYTEYGAPLMRSFNPFEAPYTIQIGPSSLLVSVAATREERRQGLSGVESMESDQGKLFIFEESGYHGIWMKDMLFPIDIIWVSADFQIVHIERSAHPSTYINDNDARVFSPSTPAKYVIEVNADYTRQYGIEVGDTISLPPELRY